MKYCHVDLYKCVLRIYMRCIYIYIYIYEVDGDKMHAHTYIHIYIYMQVYDILGIVYCNVFI